VTVTRSVVRGRVLFEADDTALHLVGVGGRAGSHRAEVLQGGAGVVEGVSVAAVLLEEDRDVLARSSCPVDVAADLLVLDRLLVVANGVGGSPARLRTLPSWLWMVARYSWWSGGVRSSEVW